ncbi:cell division protein SepF [Halomicronema sp. CCY15110]|uniref:cell division protein SepF n=1 Tax=Halomicronema sp. CCY15110 TaxID=2767773 RepID=UPI0019523910|nr:cell division protein SepF [Halomicronema sp. CCY15110]
MKRMILGVLDALGWLEPEDKDANYNDLWLQENEEIVRTSRHPRLSEEPTFFPDNDDRVSPQGSSMSQVPFPAQIVDFQRNHRNVSPPLPKRTQASTIPLPQTSFKNFTGLEKQPCEVAIINLTTFDEVGKALKELGERKLVIVNLLCTAVREKQRVLDVISGGTSIIDGSAERVGEDTFLFAPNTIRITNEELETGDLTEHYANDLPLQDHLLVEAC